MQIIIATLVAGLAATTLDFAKIETVVPQDWTITNGQGIRDCTRADCRVSSKAADKVFVGVVFNGRITDTQYPKSQQAIDKPIHEDFRFFYGDYLRASLDKPAYDGVNILANPASPNIALLVEGLYSLEAAAAGKLSKDNVILTLSYAQYKQHKEAIDELNIKAVAVKFDADPIFAENDKLGDNVVCLANDDIAANIFDACNKQVYNTETKDLDQLSPGVKKCEL